MLLISSHPELDLHDTGEGHPERAERVEAAERGFLAAGLESELRRLAPREATRAELTLVHDARYLDQLMDLCVEGGGQLDPDTQLSTGSWHTAVLAAGAGLAAVGAIDELRNAGGAPTPAFVLTRPPGHHASRAVGSGFCLLNNIAVTAAALVARGERVAIIDWDVHHGNGTQDIFYETPGVLYLSVHQAPMYPGTGRVLEQGAGLGRGTTFNAPLPPHSAGPAYRALFEQVFLPVAEAFSPTWVLVSAGFDAHRDDPLADMGLTAGDYADLTERVVALAGSERPVVLFLEGGYDLDALTNSVGACAAALVGQDFRPEPASTGEIGLEQVATYRGVLLSQW